MITVLRAVQALALSAVLLSGSDLLAHEAPAVAQATLSAADRELYKAAFQQADARRYGRARAHAAKGGSPLLTKVVRWLELSGAESGDFAEIAAFLAENPHWPRQGELQDRAERAMAATLPPEQTLAWFRARPARTVEGAVLHAQALLRAGHADEARSLLRDTWINRNFGRVQERSFRRRFGEMLEREDYIARLDRLLWDNRVSAARSQGRRLGKGYAQLAEARILLRRARPGVDYALRQVPKALRDDPGLIFDRALWRQRKGRSDGVVELIGRLGTAMPHPERWWPLRQWAAREAMDQGDHAQAYRLASSHGLETGVGFAEGEWLAGWIALTYLKQPEQAYRHFTRLFEGVSSPISLARGAYWAAEAAQALANPAWAKGWHKVAAQHATTFYGQLAALRLDQPSQVRKFDGLEPSAEARRDFERRELVRIARLLAEVGEDELLELFLARLRALAESAMDYVLTAELSRDLGRQDLAVRVAKNATYRGILIIDHLYPLPSFGLPEGDGLEPALTLAVIRQESEFRGRAVSGAGARGLMQLMPATARSLARKLKLGYNRDRLTVDPHYNVRLGQAYLARLVARYDGSYLLALAAYNAGPARVDRWLRERGDPRDSAVDAVAWIERIPYNETRNYVQRVLEGVTVYRQRLASTRTALPLEPATAELGIVR